MANALPFHFPSPAIRSSARDQPLPRPVPTELIPAFGLPGILAIVFAESGLLIGFFLPGDSLLFTAGLLVADGAYLTQPLWLVCPLIVAAAIIGDQVGCLFGRKVGRVAFVRENIEAILVGIVVVSVVPVAIELLRSRRASRAAVRPVDR